ncbi:MAG: endonuclease/exonuclease/phosphatase family protein [Bifidobacteriaceae bacterium]|jgi:endonuclease/exonuclease/phosphatase family metal-dependent hydrolase|nr:endonuclease/exonuclease/phosphatase family protein [Bifidobacteriaceae bacterium]
MKFLSRITTTVLAATLTIGWVTAPDSALAVSLGRPEIVFMEGNKQVAVSWVAVPGATSYKVELSTAKSFPKKRTKTKTIKGTAVTFKSLVNKRHYKLRVTALAGRGSKRASKISDVRPNTNSPLSLRGKVNAIGTGQDQFRVSWKRTRTATSIQVMAATGANYLHDRKGPARNFKLITAIPLTSTFVDFKLPAEMSLLAGSRSGNALFVSVIIKNGPRTIVSPPVVAWPTPPQADNLPTLRFASYNILSVPSSERRNVPKWPERRDAVAAAIVRSQADVVGVQECSDGIATDNGLPQYADLARVLEPYGYQLAYPASAIDRSKAPGATFSAQVFYKTATVERLDGSPQSTHALAKGAAWTKAAGTPGQDRWFAWAKLRNRVTGAQFFFTSIHLTQGASAATVATRNGQIGVITSFIDRMAGGLPAVLVGDFNTNPLLDKGESQVTYTLRQGWTSAAAATNRDVQFASTNLQDSKYDGWPPKPYINSYGVGQRIDGIYTKRVARSHYFAVQVVLNPDGTFDSNYRGSDHNLVLADLPVG